ncbi:MAG: hypothetical protein AAGJ83_10200, partial [Planctomycetota bacterium]
GSGSRAQLLSVDLADWEVFRIDNARTGAPLYWYESDGFIEIETNYSGMEESNQVLIKADQLISGLPSGERVGEPVALRLPRVVGSGDQREPVTIQSADLSISGGGRRALVIDLDASTSIERVEAEDSDGFAGTRRFSVMPPESAAELIGLLVLQPPRLVIQPSVDVEYTPGRRPLESDGSVRTVVNWKVESQTDLEGRLRIGIPWLDESAVANPDEPAIILAADSTDPADESEAPPIRDVVSANKSRVSDWRVLVNDLPADLRPVPSAETNPSDEGIIAYFDLISDSLADSSFEIRFETTETVKRNDATQQSDCWVGLPFPVVDDVTLRDELTLNLRSEEDFELSLADGGRKASGAYRSLPRQPLRLQIAPTPTRESDLTIADVVIRTAISELAQHDQLLFVATGAGELALPLRNPMETDVEVRVESEPASYRIAQGTLFIRLREFVSESASQERLVDVRLWADRESRGGLSMVQPLVDVGASPNMLYWQLTTPGSEHLIWATPSLGRLMNWTVDRWRLVRRTLLSENALINRVAGPQMGSVELSEMPTGNRYLFSALDDRAFRVRSASQALLWLWVAGAIIVIASLLTYCPITRHPLTVALALIAASGVVLLAPDAAIIAGQIAVLSMTLVVVMLAIRRLVLPRRSTVLASSSSGRSDKPSGRLGAEPMPRSSAATFTIGSGDLASAHDEVAS